MRRYEIIIIDRYGAEIFRGILDGQNPLEAFENAIENGSSLSTSDPVNVFAINQQTGLVFRFQCAQGWGAW